MPIDTRRIRSAGPLLAALLLTVTLSGCREYEPSPILGAATRLTIDGARVGVGGKGFYPRLRCDSKEPGEAPWQLMRWDRTWGGKQAVQDWQIAGTDGLKASLWLQYLPGEDPPLWVDLQLGKASYRPGPDTIIDAVPPTRETVNGTQTWTGSATFEGLVRESGPAFRGQETIGRLVIEWRCATE